VIGNGRIVVFGLIGIVAAAAFVHFMREPATSVPPIPARKAPAMTTQATAAPAPTPAANVADVPPWMRTDLSTPKPAASAAPAFVPTPAQQVAAIVNDPGRSAEFTARGVDMDALRNNLRLNQQITPLLQDVRRLAADSSNPQSREALKARLEQIRVLQKQMVYDVRVGARR
jgi:hypothetical protein